MALGIVNTNSVTSGSSGGGSGSGGGGIEPSNMRQLTILAANNGVSIKFQEPDDTIIDGQTLCSWKGVKIVAKQGDYPEDENDGLEILDCQERGKYINEFFRYTGLVNGNEYYVQAFPYSDNYVYNRNRKNSAKIVPLENSRICLHISSEEITSANVKVVDSAGVETNAIMDGNRNIIAEFDQAGIVEVAGQKFNIQSLGETIFEEVDIYGYTWDMSEMDPESSISYPSTVKNYNFERPTIGSDAAENIDIGQWQEFHEFVGCRPVMLTFDGEVAFELNHEDQLKKIDGLDSDIKNVNNELNAMVEFPKRYFKRWETVEPGVTYKHKYNFRVCKYKLNEEWKCHPWLYGDSEETAKENDFIYLGMFGGSYQATAGTKKNVVVSLPDKTLVNFNTHISYSFTSYNNFFKNNGEGWNFFGISDNCMLLDYMVMMGKSTDAQAHFGNGVSSSNTNAAVIAYGSGYLVSTGPYAGSTRFNTATKFMWIENIYTGPYRMMQGLASYNRVLYYKSFPPYEITYNTEIINKYKKTDIPSIEKGGYISKVFISDGVIIPSAFGGTQGKFTTDAANVNPTKSVANYFYAYGGGPFDDAKSETIIGLKHDAKGVFSMISTGINDENYRICATICYKKQLQ